MFQRSLAGVAGLLGVLTLAGAALIFIILPRINRGQFMQSFASRSSVSSGFSQEVQLGGIGQIQQSNAVVMHIKLLYGKLPPDPHWRGLSLANFDGHLSNPSQTHAPHGLMDRPLDLSSLNHGSFALKTAKTPHLSTLGYKVMMEPLGLDVFFLAPVALRISGQYRVVEVAARMVLFLIRTTDLLEPRRKPARTSSRTTLTLTHATLSRSFGIPLPLIIRRVLSSCTCNYRMAGLTAASLILPVTLRPCRLKLSARKIH